MYGSYNHTSVLSGIRDQWGFANTLTFFRCVVVLPCLVLIFVGYYQITLTLAVLAAISDAEGIYARLTNTTTELGRVFDPRADKLFTDMLLVALAFDTGNMWILILVVITIAYDVDNTSRRIGEIISACQNRERVVNATPVTIVSKSKTAVLFVVILWLLASADVDLLQIITDELRYLDLPEAVVITDRLLKFSIALVVISWGMNRRSTLARFM